MYDLVKFSRHLAGYLLIVVLLCLPIVSSTCPPDAEQKIMLCTASTLGIGVSPDESPPPNSLKEGISMAKKTCKNSQLRVAADCILSIMNKCQGTTEQEQTLQRLVNRHRLADAVDYFCTNFNIYERHMPCIKSQHELAANCSKDATDRFKTMIKVDANMDVLLSATCTFRKAAMNCLYTYVNQNCGQEASNFLRTVFDGFEPPRCSPEKEYTYNKGSGRSRASILTFSPVVLALQLYLWVHFL